MRRKSPRVALALAALSLIGFAPPPSPPAAGECGDGVCVQRLTATQLLQRAEQLVLSRRFDEVQPMLAALSQAPELQMEAHFLQGYVAAETGDLAGATKSFRAVLRDRPDLTRARLELARVLMMRGEDRAADHHFRLAEQDKDLPPEIARTVRGARSILRTRKTWHVNVEVGLAPDSNVNNATDVESVSLDFGNGYKEYLLDGDARRRSGTGVTASISSGVRLRLSDGMAVVVDADGQMVNHKGTAADDVSALLAAGPELTLTKGTRVAIQAVGTQRWFGGDVVQRAYGGRMTVQHPLGEGARLAGQLDVRRLESGFSPQYDGWQYGVSASYERVIHRSLIASASVYARRENLNAAAYSSTEFGTMLGVGGELPLGINAGVSGGVSRVLFDEPVYYMSPEPRREWRFNGRVYVGARSLRLLGFSPSLTYSYNRADSTLDLYRTDRHRLQFGLARYF